MLIKKEIPGVLGRCLAFKKVSPTKSMRRFELRAKVSQDLLDHTSLVKD